MIMLVLVMALPAMSQTAGTKGIGQNIEDSDLISSSDYYSGKLMVRSSSEVYFVTKKKDTFPRKETHYYITLKNKSNNTLYTKKVYDRRSGKVINSMLMSYEPEKGEMDAIIRKVFPKCTFDNDIDNGNSFISFYMAVDTETEKVTEVVFRINCKNGDPLLSIPPSKFRELESLMKGHLTVKIPEESKYASYHTADYFVHFSTFRL